MHTLDESQGPPGICPPVRRKGVMRMTQGHPTAGLQSSTCRRVAVLFCEASSLHPSQGQRLLPKSASEALTSQGVQGNPVAALAPPFLPFPAKPWPQAAGRTPCLPPCSLLSIPLPSPARSPSPSLLPALALLPSLPSAQPTWRRQLWIKSDLNGENEAPTPPEGVHPACSPAHPL